MENEPNPMPLVCRSMVGYRLDLEAAVLVNDIVLRLAQEDAIYGHSLTA